MARTMDARRQEVEETVFDALVVCNGHYSVPRTPAVAGAGAFPGRQMHSHSYRDAAPFAGQTVVVVGAAASGEDISREVADVADTARPAAAHALAAPHLLPVVIFCCDACVQTGCTSSVWAPLRPNASHSMQRCASCVDQEHSHSDR